MTSTFKLARPPPTYSPELKIAYAVAWEFFGNQFYMIEKPRILLKHINVPWPKTPSANISKLVLSPINKVLRLQAILAEQNKAKRRFGSFTLSASEPAIKPTKVYGRLKTRPVRVP